MQKNNSTTVVRELPGKGRCLFATQRAAPGDTVLSEAPIMVSLPSDAPALFALLEELHRAAPFACGHVRSHFAAICTLSQPPPVYAAVMDKGAPRGERERLQHEVARCARAAAKLLPGADFSDLAQLICGWEFNGFPADGGALVLYDRVSTAAHSCDPNVEVVVLFELENAAAAARAVEAEPAAGGDLVFDDEERAAYERYLKSAGAPPVRKGDVFDSRYAGLEFRALRAVAPGDEIVFSYCLTAEDLRRDFRRRRKVLNLRHWSFTCYCDRCVAESRAFLRDARGVREDDERASSSDESSDAPAALVAVACDFEDY
jgi:hypothetical protein